MTEGQPARPANMTRIVAINQGRAPLTMALPAVPSPGPAAVRDLLADDHTLIDTRDVAAFGAAHIPGSVNVQLDSSEFEQRVGWVTPAEAPLLLLTTRDEEVPAALRRLAFVGLDHRVRGALAGGMDAWIAAGLPVASVPQVGVRELREASRPVQLLDVREPSEWEEGHIPGAAQMSFKELPAQWERLGLDPDRQVVVTCATGMRSSTAASLLRRLGFADVANVSGGTDAWRAAGFPIARGD